MDQQVNLKKIRPDVLMLALARHDRSYSSTAWSLAKGFAEQGRVFFIDNPFTFSEFFVKEKKYQIRKRYNIFFGRKKDVLQVEGINVNVIVAPLMVPINWLPAGRIYKLLSRFNNWRLRRVVNRVLKKYAVQDYIYINSFNPFYGASADFEPAPGLYIYQTVDNISQSRYVSKHGPRLEKEAMQQADLCVATSEELRKKAAGIAGKAICVPNAADIRLFSKAGSSGFEKPEELKGEDRKVICYIGSIDHRLDYELLKTAASLHKDKLFMMVGPLTGRFCQQSGFSDLPNVRFTGKKSLEELPAYLQYAHCTIIPFVCNELTASIYPLKINEYLSAGKPVVTTPFSQDICTFEEVVALRSEGAEFAEAIERMIVNDSPAEKQKRIKVASHNDWNSRVLSLYELAEGVVLKEERKERKSSYEKAVG